MNSAQYLDHKCVHKYMYVYVKRNCHSNDIFIFPYETESLLKHWSTAAFYIILNIIYGVRFVLCIVLYIDEIINKWYNSVMHKDCCIFSNTPVASASLVYNDPFWYYNHQGKPLMLTKTNILYTPSLYCMYDFHFHNECLWLGSLSNCSSSYLRKSTLINKIPWDSCNS